MSEIRPRWDSDTPLRAVRWLRARGYRLGALAVLAHVALVLASGPVLGQRNALPAELQSVGVTQRLGESLPMDAAFLDEAGRDVVLGDLLGDRPAIVALVYYDCPMLCNMVLDGVAKSVKPLKLAVGVDYDVVVVSFAPGETPEQARMAKMHLFERYGHGGEGSLESGWHFLTGSEESIALVTEAVGFGYEWVEEAGEYAHSAAIAVATPDGKIARYFYGIDYPPGDLKLALVEASEERIGSLVDQVLLFCYRYDPATGQYTFAVWAVVRAAGVLTAFGIGLYVFLTVRRDKRRRHRRSATAH